jgi:hypothetical protein
MKETINPNTSTARIYGYTILIGTGVGCFQSAGVAVASAIAPPSDINRAVSVMTIGMSRLPKWCGKVCHHDLLTLLGVQ